MGGSPARPTADGWFLVVGLASSPAATSIDRKIVGKKKKRGHAKQLGGT
jgi:hypothetical protein